VGKLKPVINAKNYTLSGFVKGEIEERFDKISKYFRDDSTATVTVKGEKSQLKKVEITVNIRNNTLRSEVSDYDVRTAIDKALEKIERQLIKHKEKLQLKSADSIRFENIESAAATEPSRIVKNKRFELLPMTEEEACFQLELLEHAFFVFRNKSTNTICVVYKREDGDYGMIEPESASE